MAVITSRPSGGGLSRFAGSQSYEGVANKYASAFIAALAAKKRLELDTNLLAYANGDITFEELRNYLNQQIESEGDTQYGLLLKQTLSQYAGVENDRKRESRRAELEADAIQDGVITAEDRLEIEREMLKFESPGTEEYTNQQENVIQAFENFETDKVNRAFTTLAAELGGDNDGLTLQDQLTINLQLQEVANKQSDVYATLIEQEGTLRNRIFEQGRSGRSSDINRQLGVAFNELDASDRQIEEAFLRGQTMEGENVNAEVAITALLQNSLERRDILDEAVAAGANVSDSDYTAATTVNSRLLAEPKTIEGTQELLSQLQTGGAVEVTDRKGEPRIVTKEDMIRDAALGIGDFTTPNIRVVQDEFNNFSVVDASTGEVIQSNITSQSSARQIASNLYTGFTVNRWGDPAGDPWVATGDTPETLQFARESMPNIKFNVISTDPDILFNDLQTNNPQMFDAAEIGSVLRSQGRTEAEIAEIEAARSAPQTGGPTGIIPRIREGINNVSQEIVDRSGISAEPSIRTPVGTARDLKNIVGATADIAGPRIRPAVDAGVERLAETRPVQRFVDRTEGLRDTFSGIRDVGRSLFGDVENRASNIRRSLADVGRGLLRNTGIPRIETPKEEPTSERPNILQRISSGIKSFIGR